MSPGAGGNGRREMKVANDLSSGLDLQRVSLALSFPT